MMVMKGLSQLRSDLGSGLCFCGLGARPRPWGPGGRLQRPPPVEPFLLYAVCSGALCAPEGLAPPATGVARPCCCDSGLTPGAGSAASHGLLSRRLKQSILHTQAAPGQDAPPGSGAG